MKQKSLLTLAAAFSFILIAAQESYSKSNINVKKVETQSEVETSTEKTYNNKVGVVDIDKIIQESTAIASIQKRVEKQKSEYESEINKRQDELKSEQKKIEDKRDILSKEAFEKEAKNFEKKADALKTYTDKKQNSLKKAWVDGMGKINDKVKSIVAEIAKEKGIKIVAQSSQILYFEPELDITAEVLKILNKKMPKIDVKFE